MSRSRPLIALAGLALGGIALVGIGAGATFSTSTASSQKITAGTVGVSVSAPNATNGCTSAAANCSSLTLPDVGPVGSTFETPATHITVTNTGDIPAYFDAIQMTQSNNGSSASAALVNEMNICIMSHDTSGTWVEGNGPFTTALNLHPSVKENPVKLNPGETASYWVGFYAGQDSSLCGTTTSDGPNTTTAWQNYSGVYHTPNSLTNAAEGGSVTATLHFSFTG